MPVLLTDSNNIPVPQYLKEDGSAFENSRGHSGGFDVNVIEPIATIGAVKAVKTSLVNNTDGASLPATTATGLLVDVSQVQGEVAVKDAEELATVVSAGAGTTSTGSPNDTTVFPDIVGTSSKGVQVYAASSANIIALIIEAKIDTKYYPLLVVAPSALTDLLALSATLSPKFNGILTPTWRIKLITVTAETPTISASYQYIQ